MGNEIKFALGLDTSKFQQAIAGAMGAAKGMIAAYLGFGALKVTIFDQIAKGAALEALSRRTGETVGNLYKLGAGFKACTVSADGLPTAFLTMQRALGGVNEMGEKTSEVFAAMGLDVESLGKMNGLDKFQAIIAGLQKLNLTDRAQSAMKIFGRGMGGDILQIAGSGRAFASAIEGAASKAADMERYAHAMHEFERIMPKLEGQLKAVFIKPAGWIAEWGVAMDNAFKNSQAPKMLELSLKGALLEVSNYGESLLKGLPDAIATLWPAALNRQGLYLKTAGSSIMGALDMAAGQAERLFPGGGSKATADYFDKQAEGHIADARKGFKDVFGMGDVIESALKAAKEAQKTFAEEMALKTNPFFEQLKQFYLKPGLPEAGGQGGGGHAAEAGALGAGGNRNTSSDALSSIGFIFAGRASQSSQHFENIDRNTLRMTTLLQHIEYKIGMNPGVNLQHL